jgi:hypothetical protein
MADLLTILDTLEPVILVLFSAAAVLGLVDYLVAIFREQGSEGNPEGGSY